MKKIRSFEGCILQIKGRLPVRFSKLFSRSKGYGFESYLIHGVKTRPGSFQLLRNNENKGCREWYTKKTVSDTLNQLSLISM